jgi:formylmethanofuran dehydrogenase subunit E
MMSEETKETKSENKDAGNPVEPPKAEAPKQEAPKPEAPKQEAPKAEAPKPEEPKQEASGAEAPKADAPKPEEKKKEKPSNCAVCNKSIKKKRYYYRNGKYFCTQRCFKTTVKKASQEAADKAGETGTKQ